MVAINYVLTMANGTVVSTNNEILAKQFGLKNYVKGPFRFIVGQSGQVKGFDDALLGMELGQKEYKIVPPSEPVLQLAVNLTRRLIRNQPFPRFRTISLKRFHEIFGQEEPLIGKNFTNASLPWPYLVDNVSDDTVVIEPAIEEKQTVHIPGYAWNSTLLIKTNLKLLFRHNPTKGQIIDTEFGPAKIDVGEANFNMTYQAKVGDIIKHYVPIQGAASVPYQFKVTHVDDKKFIIRRTNWPAQETLNLTIELLEWEKNVKEVKTTLVAKTN
jgi:hypothetical protein